MLELSQSGSAVAVGIIRKRAICLYFAVLELYQNGSAVAVVTNGASTDVRLTSQLQCRVSQLWAELIGV